MAIGVFLFDGALAGALIAAGSLPSSPVGGSWAIPLPGMFGSAVFAFVAATIGRLEAGPELADVDAKSDITAAQTAAKSELFDAIRKNRAVTRTKETALGFALALLALTFVGYGLFLWVGHSVVAFVSSHGSQFGGLLLAGCLAVLMVFICAREG